MRHGRPQQRAREIARKGMGNLYDPEHCEWQRRLIDYVADFAAAEHQRGVDEGLEQAAAYCEEVGGDAQDKLGMVNGNMAFENGRMKAASQLLNTIRARIGKGHESK